MHWMVWAHRQKMKAASRIKHYKLKKLREGGDLWKDLEWINQKRNARSKTHKVIPDIETQGVDDDDDYDNMLGLRRPWFEVVKQDQFTNALGLNLIWDGQTGSVYKCSLSLSAAAHTCIRLGCLITNYSRLKPSVLDLILSFYWNFDFHYRTCFQVLHLSCNSLFHHSV